jgi:PPP family 3-phenylpropionic acid transporter
MPPPRARCASLALLLGPHPRNLCSTLTSERASKRLNLTSNLRTSRFVNALRLYYLAIYLGLGAVLPLLALAMQARGFRPSEYAWLMAFLPLSRMLAPPLWGALADRWLGTSKLLRINSLFAAAAMLALTQRMGVVLTVLVFASWALFSSSLNPLAEAGTYRLLGQRPRNFGYVRVFGSVGFALSACAFGLFGVDKELALPFAVAAASYVGASFAAYGLADADMRPHTPLRQAVAALVKRPDVRLLWTASTLYYASHGAFDMYFGPHARRIPGVDTGMISGAWAVGVIAEIVIFFFVPRWLHGRTSSWLLLLCALVASLRWFLLAQAHSALAIWLLAPLHAITFGAWYLAFAHENQAGSSPEIRATVQGLGAACLGLGTVSATLVGGYLLERFGGERLFEVAGLAALSAAALFALRVRHLAAVDKRVAVPVTEP